MPKTGMQKYAGGFLCLAVMLLLSAPSGSAAVILVNGLFTATGTNYGSGLSEATGWTNNSGLLIQASVAPSGFEGTDADGGSNYLRLVSDYPDPDNTGFIVQDLGTMVAGDTYLFTGNALGGDGTSWGATVELTSDGSATPATVYSSQILSGYGPGVLALGALQISYTATAADDGNPLFLWLQAQPSTVIGTAIRGGLADIQLTTLTSSSAPEPGTDVLLGGALAGLALLSRKLIKR